ncbi:imidazole glycerol phosphate synthase subunit HisH [Dongia deserti]|uniref:imidazole glycerol phosphate synthase subunit HisH n=1 Tax=Dongia deserti TaxID=2268030 RepID=UPI000E652F4A|nr:imidazole glycerol phosphate synthase subunit HisH [Dongia deserti]
MQVAIVDYGAGNLRSAEKALAAAAKDSARVIVTADPDAVRKADRIVLPGVGAFAACKHGLDSLPGMVEALEEAVLKQGKPFLGICVGMQLMASVGVEFGTHKGLDWIKGKVVVLDPADKSLRIPQMGWNDLKLAHVGHRALAATRNGDHAYFVHSFHFVADRSQDVLATVEYGGPVTAIIGRDNLLGVQFHPEKSQQVGLTLLASFLKWNP